MCGRMAFEAVSICKQFNLMDQVGLRKSLVCII